MTEVKFVGNLPLQPTQFIGREAEVAQITPMLTEPSARLVTLVGPGGIGKTRLAIQVAQETVGSFASGAYFVALQSLSAPEMLVTALIDSLKFSLQGHDDPLPQLIRHLHDKHLLLILDNFEHLLAGIDVLLEILDNAPQVKFLVTSREVLNLRQEWIVPVGGMPFPAERTSTNADNFGAVRLFVECARRIRPDFSLADERRHVARICQLVEGVPLAIELAASWLKSLPCAEIALEIQRNLDFLDTKLRDLPPRHRSIRAVFDHSWTLLSPKEQSIFSQLAIFRGGFRREAAEDVTSASLIQLSALIDKSLIRVDNNGRYQIHELLRQFAQEKLDQSPDVKQALRECHSLYYGGFLDNHCLNLSNGMSGSVYEQVLEDVDNIWTAWDYALQQQDEKLIAQFLVPLYRLLNEQNRYYDGERVYRRALAALEASNDQDSLTYARASLCLALCLQFMTRYDEALIYAERALPVLEQHDAQWERWNVQSCLANIAYSRGNYQVAQVHFENVREMLLTAGDPSALVVTLSRLSDLAAVRGDYAAAKRFLSESVSELETLGNNRGRIRFLITLGDIEYKIGNYEKAEAHFVAAMTISRALENTMTHAISLVSLGRVAYALHDFARTEAFCRESIILFDEVRHLWGKAFALIQLGRAYMELEQFEQAHQHLNMATTIAENTGSQSLKALCYCYRGRLHALLRQPENANDDFHSALAIAIEVSAEPLILDIFAAVAETAATFGYEQWAITLTAAVLQNDRTEFATRAKALVLFEQLNAENVRIPEVLFSKLAESLLAALDQGFEEVAPVFRFVSEPAQPLETTLDALTERELEILRLLADGYPNRTIAEQLILGVGTIKAHNHNIFSKLGVHNRVQAISRARDLRLI